jgi:hypothetical protein
MSNRRSTRFPSPRLNPVRLQKDLRFGQALPRLHRLTVFRCLHQPSRSSVRRPWWLCRRLLLRRLLLRRLLLRR